MMLPESISPELRAYLADWLAWTERGATEGKPYSRRFGVCGAMDSCPGKHLSREMGWVLQAQFGKRHLFPFGGHEESAREYSEAAKHLSPRRLTWVRMMLGTYDEFGRRSFNVGPALRQVSTAATIAATIEWYRAVQHGRGLYDSDERCASQTGISLGILEDGER